MTSDIVISARNLGKSYAVGHRSAQSGRANTFRDVVVQSARQLARTTRDMIGGKPVVEGDEVEEFWALKDVGFEIRRGDVVGIIGRNGAGKSTLLKILSRITEPTEGRVEIKGRVASLLEVGTGFHPELTGRENIYLNGAILGMTRSEIARKFDEIIAFAEVERFLDTPVKRYSSGMYVRLAFAVAAHLEPEILVVDEVLAVGDAEFQKKCIGKMRDVAGRGRTVLFVSHNIPAVTKLCDRAILIDGGRVTFDGDVAGAVACYSFAGPAAGIATFPGESERPSITRIHVDQAALAGQTLVLEIDFSSPWPLRSPVGGVTLRAATSEPVWGSNGRFHASGAKSTSLSRGRLRCEARHLPLSPGDYLVSVWLGEWNQDHDSRLDVLSIRLGDKPSDHLRPPPSAIGYLDWPAVWEAAPTEGTSDT